MLLRRKRGSHEVAIEESSTKSESELALDFLDSAPKLTALYVFIDSPSQK